MSQTAVIRESGRSVYSLRWPLDMLPSPITPMPITSFDPNIRLYEAAIAANAVRVAKLRRVNVDIKGILQQQLMGHGHVRANADYRLCREFPEGGSKCNAPKAARLSGPATPSRLSA